ncbi:TPA: glycosyltransferase family 2 protein [Vibrio vulnificus]|nr:glycosyltransferase family 2 protein [Vibrio vulnificus]
MNNPLVSIITPAYNCQNSFYETYISVVSQSYCKWEWIITEDHSVDETYSYLLKLSITDNRIKILRNSKNEGAAISRNNSISHSNGDFLAFIDSDDVWLPNKLESQVEFMIANNIDFSFTAYELIDEGGNKLNKTIDTHHNAPLSYADMLKKKATLGCSTVMLKKSSFVDLDMPLLRTGQDYALWLKLLKTGVDAYPITDVFTQYRILPNSISRNKYKKAKRQWEIYRSVENLALIESIICFCFYAWRAVFRK